MFALLGPFCAVPPNTSIARRRIECIHFLVLSEDPKERPIEKLAQEKYGTMKIPVVWVICQLSFLDA